MGGIVRSVKKFVSPVVSFLTGGNPLVTLAGSLFLAWALRPKVPDVPDFGTDEMENFERGLLINKQSNDANIPVVYGERLIGGVRTFLSTSGTDNQYLYMALVLCEGEIDSIQELRVDDKVVTLTAALTHGTVVNVADDDSNFYKSGQSHIRVQAFMGKDNQTASSVLDPASGWGSNHRNRGLAYLALRFKWNQDIFSSIPKVQAKVRGKKVVSYNSSLVAQSASFTRNPAWCILDYLTNTRYGKGLATSEIDLQSFYDASVVCDTEVEPYSGGSNIKIFETNGALDTSRTLIDNLRDLIKGCRGYIPYSQGKYGLVIETTGTASITLTEDDIIGGYSLSMPQKNERYNRVICSFVNPDRNFQVDEIQFPPLDDSGLPSADQHATMKSEDGNILLEGRFSFPTLTNKFQAEEMAEVILRRSRQALTVAVNVSFKGYELNIADIVNITHASLGFSAKPFRVLGITFNEDYTVGLSLVEHQDAHYTWATKEQAEAVPTTSFPNPFSIEPPASVTLTDDLVEYNDGTVITRLNIEIGASTDNFVEEYEVEMRQDTDRNGDAITDNFRVVSRGIALRHQVINVIDNATYTIRVRGRNGVGARSTYVAEARQIIGQTAVPSDVENFSINVVGDQATLAWTAITDLDLDFYVIKFSTDTTSPSWQNSIDLIPRVGRPATSVTCPLQTGAYLIKAQDKLGNQSSNETIVITNIATTNFVNIQTINEHTAFSGTKTGVELITRNSTNFIGLTATGTVGDTATRVGASGTYDFNNTIDLGGKFVALFTASVTQFIEDVSEVFDNGRPTATTLFDDGRPNPFDGVSSGKAHTILEVATSDDNSTFSEFKPFIAGEHIGRYFKFRVLFTSDDLKGRALISSLSVTAKLSKRREVDNDVSSGTGGKAITFTNAFKTNPAVGISAQNMDTGDYYTITSKSTTGFTIEFFDSSDTSINRTFDYIAEGHGQVIT